MLLDVNGMMTESPSRADIDRAVPSGPAPEDWSIELNRMDGLSIEADREGDGRFSLAYVEGGKRHDATRQVGAKELREILVLFLEGNEAWRQRVTWTPYQPKKQSSSALAGPGKVNWLILLPVATFAGGYFLYELPHLLRRIGIELPRLPNLAPDKFPLPPAFDSIPARMLLIFAGLILLVFLVAAGVKLWQVRRAARWHKTAGRILSSAIGTDHARSIDGPSEVRNVPRVRYEFSVNGKTYTGSRIDFAEKPTESENEAVLRRYPKGTIVAVYYDPADPSQCVLERGLPKLLGFGCLGLLVGGIGLVALAMWLMTVGPTYVHQWLPKSQPHVFSIAVGLGLAFLLFLAADRKKRAAAAAWPTVSGTVVRSETEVVTRSAPKGATRVHYPVVEYRYQAGGQTYHSRQIQLDSKAGGPPGFAQKRAARYPAGAAVMVRYDPKNPGEAALELGHGATIILLTLTLVAFAVALVASGMFWS